MNETTNHSQTTANPAILFHEPWNTIYDAIAITVLVVGAALNSMTVYLYYRGKIVRSNFHYSLNIMSIVSIVQQFSFVPYIAYERKIEYPSKSLLVSVQCSFSYALHAFFNACFINVYLICFLAVQRYIIITRPMKSLTFTNKTCRNYIIGVVIYIGVTSSPNLLSFRTDVDGFCRESFMFGYQFSQYFAFFIVMSGLAVPTIVMVTAYILTIYHMFGKSHELEQDIALRKHRLKIVKSLGILIAIFLFCWTPFSMNYLVSYFGVYTFDRDGTIYYRQVNKIVLLPTTMMATFNAITFALSSRDIRKAASSIKQKASTSL